MERLRFVRLWRLIGWLLVIGVVYLSLTPSPPNLELTIPAQDKVGHFIAYTLLAWWFSQVYPWRLQGQLGLLLVSLGILLEILQYFGGYRYFDYADMLANTLGVIGGYLLAQTPAGRVLRGLEWIWETRLAAYSKGD
jgi:VanZ family protein